MSTPDPIVRFPILRIIPIHVYTWSKCKIPHSWNALYLGPYIICCNFFPCSSKTRYNSQDVCFTLTVCHCSFALPPVLSIDVPNVIYQKYYLKARFLPKFIINSKHLEMTSFNAIFINIQFKKRDCYKCQHFKVYLCYIQLICLRSKTFTPVLWF